MLYCCIVTDSGWPLSTGAADSASGLSPSQSSAAIDHHTATAAGDSVNTADALQEQQDQAQAQAQAEEDAAAEAEANERAKERQAYVDEVSILAFCSA